MQWFLDWILKAYRESPRIVFVIWVASGLLLLPLYWLRHLYLDGFASQNRHVAALCFIGSSSYLAFGIVAYIWRAAVPSRQFRARRTALGTMVTVIPPKHLGAKQGVPNGLLYEDDSDTPELNLAVIGFRNEANEKRKLESPKVTSQIIYFDDKGQEVANAPAGVWVDIGISGKVATFNPGYDKWLAIFLQGNSGEVMRVWNRGYYVSGNLCFEIRGEKIAKNIASVQIRLLAEEMCFKVVDLKVSMSDNKHLPQLRLPSRWSFLGWD